MRHFRKKKNKNLHKCQFRNFVFTLKKGVCKTIYYRFLIFFPNDTLMTILNFVMHLKTHSNVFILKYIDKIVRDLFKNIET